MSIETNWFAITNKISEGVFLGVGAAVGIIFMLLAFKLIGILSSKDSKKGKIWKRSSVL